MAKIGFKDDIRYISGRLSKKGKAVYNYVAKTGKTYRTTYIDHDDPNTADQQQVRAKFTARAKCAATWWAANKPSSTNPNGTADYIKVMDAFDKQHDIANPFSFVISLVAGTTPAVQVPGATTTGGGTSTGGGISD